MRQAPTFAVLFVFRAHVRAGYAPAMLRVDIASLADGLHTYTLRPQPEDVALDDAALEHEAAGLGATAFRDITVELRLDVAERRLLASFDARAGVTLCCDRTLRPYAEAICGAHTVLFARPSLAEALGDEDVYLLPDEATHIDLAPVVRDTLLLALPLRRVSPEAETLELPTTFGRAEDDLADDRWEALRRLRPDS
ncbi:MAG: YceD family protein [Rubricoccaceae bacterium]